MYSLCAPLIFITALLFQLKHCYSSYTGFNISGLSNVYVRIPLVHNESVTLCCRFTELKRASGCSPFNTGFWSSLNVCTGALQRIHEVIERVPAPAAGLQSSLAASSSSSSAAAAAAAGGSQPAIKGDIQFCDVTFSYASRPHAPVLSGFNLHIPAGKTAVICDVWRVACDV